MHVIQGNCTWVIPFYLILFLQTKTRNTQRQVSAMFRLDLAYNFLIWIWQSNVYWNLQSICGLWNVPKSHLQIAIKSFCLLTYMLLHILYSSGECLHDFSYSIAYFFLPITQLHCHPILEWKANADNTIHDNVNEQNIFFRFSSAISADSYICIYSYL